MFSNQNRCEYHAAPMKQFRFSSLGLCYIGFSYQNVGVDRRVLRLCRNPGLNQGPLDLQSNALPTELSRLCWISVSYVAGLFDRQRMSTSKQIWALVVSWPCGPTDKASDYESGDCRFESCQGQYFFPRCEKNSRPRVGSNHQPFG